MTKIFGTIEKFIVLPILILAILAIYLVLVVLVLITIFVAQIFNILILRILNKVAIWASKNSRNKVSECIILIIKYSNRGLNIIIVFMRKLKDLHSKLVKHFKSI